MLIMSSIELQEQLLSIVTTVEAKLGKFSSSFYEFRCTACTIDAGYQCIDNAAG